MLSKKPGLVVARAKSYIFHDQIRTTIYHKYQHGPFKMNNPKPPYAKLFKHLMTKEGLKEAGKENWELLKRLYTFEWAYPKHGTLITVDDFDSEESLKRWKPVADRDSLSGYSEAKLTRSPAGHALFTGILDTRLPDDGITEKSGFAAIIGPQAPRTSPFRIQSYYNWHDYNTFRIRFRGDGRCYRIVFNTGSPYDDLSYYDNYVYPLYTRGGPYWQTLDIPFYKFMFTYKAYLQDSQPELPAYKVRFPAIVLDDGIDGPFSFEIDYFGVLYKDSATHHSSAYEKYLMKHIRQRPVVFESPTPDE